MELGGSDGKMNIAEAGEDPEEGSSRRIFKVTLGKWENEARERGWKEEDEGGERGVHGGTK